MEKRDKPATVDPTGQNRTGAARWHAEQAADGYRDPRWRNDPARIADEKAASEAAQERFQMEPPNEEELEDLCEVCEERPAMMPGSGLGHLCRECEIEEVAAMDDRSRQALGILDRTGN